MKKIIFLSIISLLISATIQAQDTQKTKGGVSQKNKDDMSAEIDKLLESQKEKVDSSTKKSWTSKDGTVFDFTKPLSVFEALRYAAKSGDYSVLPQLPQATGPQEINCIAALNPDFKGDQFFQDMRSGCNFATANYFSQNYKGIKKIGALKLEGQQGKLTFHLGPQSDLQADMSLIQNGGRWYIWAITFKGTVREKLRQIK